MSSLDGRACAAGGEARRSLPSPPASSVKQHEQWNMGPPWRAGTRRHCPASTVNAGPGSPRSCRSAAGRLQVGSAPVRWRQQPGSMRGSCTISLIQARATSTACCFGLLHYHSERATGTCATGGLLHTFRAWNSPTEFDGRRDPRARQQSSSISLRTPVARCVWPQLCVRRAASAGRQPWDLTYDETFLS